MKYSQKWAIASFFRELAIGYTFPKDDAPLHATLVGVFAIDLKQAEITSAIKTAINDFNPFSVVGGDSEEWGLVRVVTLKESQKFNQLFMALQNNFLDKGAVFNEPQYLLHGFKPHVTRQKAESLEPGETRRIMSVSLVDMFPDSDGERRRIVSTTNL